MHHMVHNCQGMTVKLLFFIHPDCLIHGASLLVEQNLKIYLLPITQNINLVKLKSMQSNFEVN
jgi:hypothetical protein